MRKPFWSLLAFATVLSACSGADITREAADAGEAREAASALFAEESVPAPELAPVNPQQVEPQAAPQIAPMNDSQISDVEPVKEVQVTPNGNRVQVQEEEPETPLVQSAQEIAVQS
jgi:hypothetical protein